MIQNIKKDVLYLNLHLHEQSTQKFSFTDNPQQSPSSYSQASMLFLSSQNPSPTQSDFPPFPKKNNILLTWNTPLQSKWVFKLI